MHLLLKSAIAVVGLAALGLAAAHPAAAQGLNGQPVTLDYLYPDQSSVRVAGGTQTVTPAGASYTFFGLGGVKVTPTQLIVTNLLGSTATYTAATFNGFHLLEVGASPSAITGVTVDPATNVAGFDSSRVSFSTSGIYLNFQGLVITGTGNVTLDIAATPAPVPEASTTVSLGLLLALGMGGLVAAGKRKKVSAEA